jgi:hypothetical protein
MRNVVNQGLTGIVLARHPVDDLWRNAARACPDKKLDVLTPFQAIRDDLPVRRTRPLLRCVTDSFRLGKMSC